MVRVQHGLDLLFFESRVRASGSTQFKRATVHQGEQSTLRHPRWQVLQLRFADGNHVRPGQERHVGTLGEALFPRTEDAELHVQEQQPVGTHFPVQCHRNVSQ